MRVYEQTVSKTAQASICVSTLAVGLPLIALYVLSHTHSFHGADYIHKVRRGRILIAVSVLK